MGAELAINGVTIKRGELTIVRDVSLTCPEGQITVLLGSNGAGKSTLMDAIAGVIPVEHGSIVLDGQEVQRLPRNRRAARGLAYVEQGRTVFAGLTVQDNLAVAARGTPPVPMSCSPSWSRAGTSPPRCSPAANSRCSSWPGPL
jgi:branched-chain amino acid transport system ATP-binding protein